MQSRGGGGNYSPPAKISKKFQPKKLEVLPAGIVSADKKSSKNVFATICFVKSLHLFT